MVKIFYDWFMGNNLKYFLNRWDYDLNQYNINAIGAGANRKIFF